MHATGSEENDEDDEDIHTQTMSHTQACQALEAVLAYIYLGQQPNTPMSTTVLVNALLSESARN